jgi:hypothetical protein
MARYLVKNRDNFAFYICNVCSWSPAQPTNIRDSEPFTPVPNIAQTAIWLTPTVTAFVYAYIRNHVIIQ